jgi:hypothetical protein
MLKKNDDIVYQENRNFSLEETISKNDDFNIDARLTTVRSSLVVRLRLGT